MELTSAIEVIWFFGLALFSTIIFFGKNTDRGWYMKLGALLITLGYLGKTQDYILSFSEIEMLTWLVRVGVTILLYDVAKRTEVSNPVSYFRRIKNDYRQ